MASYNIAIGLDNFRGWISMALSAGVPEPLVYRWVFREIPDANIDYTVILNKVDDVVKNGQTTIEDLFMTASASLANYSIEDDKLDPSMFNHVCEYLNDFLRAWQQST